MTDATWNRLVLGYQAMPVVVRTIDGSPSRRRSACFDVPDLSRSRLVDDDDEETRPELDVGRSARERMAEAAE